MSDQEFNPQAVAWYEGYAAGWAAAEQRETWNVNGRMYPIPQQPPCPYPATGRGDQRKLRHINGDITDNRLSNLTLDTDG